MSDRLNELDVSLLMALDALLIERNVSRAAHRLGITQPALSGRLGRLRLLFDDQMFVPIAGRGVTPTPRAVAVAGNLTKVLAQLRELVGPEQAFDPQLDERTFVVAAYDNPAAMLAPELLPSFKVDAPRVRLAFVLPDHDKLAIELERGDIDLFVGVIKHQHPDLLSRTLFEEEWMTAQRRGHPRGRVRPTLDEFCELDHLLISAEGAEFTGMVDRELAKLGRKRHVSISIQSYALAPLMIANSDCLCTLPRRFLQRFEPLLELFEPPLELGRFRLQALWHRRMQDDAAHRWIRERIFAAAAAQVSQASI